MNSQQLQTLFQATLSPNQQIRDEAELNLRSCEGQDGFLSCILQLLSLDNVDPGVKLSAAIFMKNRVIRSWNFVENVPPEGRNKSGAIAISALDRTSIKQNILPVLVSAAHNIVPQLSVILYRIICADTPAQWMTFPAEVQQLIRSEDIRQVHAGLIAAIQALKAWRYSMNAANSALTSELTAGLFPLIVQIAGNLLQQQTSDSAMLIRLIVKVYFHSIFSGLSEELQSTSSLVAWGGLLLRIVDLPVTQEARDEKSPSWQMKKWAYRSLNRLFSSYGNPDQLPARSKEKYAAFAKVFVSNFAPEIINMYFKQIKGFADQSVWISGRCRHYILEFFSDCVKGKTTWALINPCVMQIVRDFVFPQLCFSEDMQEEWDLDHNSFLREFLEPSDNFTTPVYACITLLLKLTTSRPKTTFNPIMSFILSILNQRPECSAQQRYGAYNMMLAIVPAICKNKSASQSLEEFFVKYVLQDYRSAYPYLRLMSGQLLFKFETWKAITWSKDFNLESQFANVVLGFKDEEVPVQVVMTLALTELIQHQPVKTAISANIGSTIEEILRISQEVEMDILSQTLEQIVEEFAEELAPYALEMTTRLLNFYEQALQEAIQQEEADTDIDFDELTMKDFSALEDKAMTGVGILSTLARLVRSLEKNIPLLISMQELILPALSFTLEKGATDYYELCYEILDCFTFYTKTITPQMWSIFTSIYRSTKGDGIDYLENMVPTMDNMISYGQTTISADLDILTSFVDIYVSSMPNKQIGHEDRVHLCKLAESLLLNLPGGALNQVCTLKHPALHSPDIVQFLPAIVSVTMSFLSNDYGPQQPTDDESTEICETTPKLSLYCRNVIMHCVAYDATCTLQLLESGSCSSGTWLMVFLTILQRDISNISRVHDIRTSVRGICAILSLPQGSLSPFLLGNLPNFIDMLLKLLSEFPKAEKKRQELQAAHEDENEDDDEGHVMDDMGGDSADDHDDDGEYSNFADDSDLSSHLIAKPSDVHDEDNEYDEALEKVLAKMHAREAGEAYADSDEEEDDEEEELELITPLDTMDVYLVFKSCMLSECSDKISERVLIEILAKALQLNFAEAFDATLNGSTERQTKSQEMVGIATEHEAGIPVVAS